MSYVFISYAKEDRPVVERLSNALRDNGFSVWWDQELTPGKEFTKEITDKLYGADAIIVLWSKISTEKEWVKSEADVGLERDVLLPIFLDEVELKPPFRLRHAVDLIGWNGNTSQSKFKEAFTKICDRLRDMAQRTGARPYSFLLMPDNGPYLSKLREVIVGKMPDLNIKYEPNIMTTGSDGDRRADKIAYRNQFSEFLKSDADWLLTNFPTGMEDVFNVSYFLDRLESNRKKVIFFDSGLQFRHSWMTKDRPLEEAPFFIFRPIYVKAAKQLLASLLPAVKKFSGRPIIFCFLFTTNIPSMGIRRIVYQTYLSGVVYRHNEVNLPVPEGLWTFVDSLEFPERDGSESRFPSPCVTYDKELKELDNYLDSREVHILYWQLGNLEGSLKRNSKGKIRRYLGSLKSSVNKGLVVFMCGNDEIAGTVHEELRMRPLPAKVGVALLGFDYTSPIQQAENYYDIVCTAEVDFGKMCDEAVILMNSKGDGANDPRDRPNEATIKNLGRLSN